MELKQYPDVVNFVHSFGLNRTFMELKPMTMIIGSSRKQS